MLENHWGPGFGVWMPFLIQKLTMVTLYTYFAITTCIVHTVTNTVVNSAPLAVQVLSTYGWTVTFLWTGPRTQTVLKC